MELVRALEAQGLALYAEKKCSDVSHNTAKCLFAFIYKYEEILPELNLAKGKLDLAYKSKNVDEFQVALCEFRAAARKIVDVKKALKSRRKMKRLKIHVDLFVSALRKAEFVERTIEGGERWMKESAMSPAQLRAARNASLRMQMAWG
jgi:hypothetical protein